MSYEQGSLVEQWVRLECVCRAPSRWTAFSRTAACPAPHQGVTGPNAPPRYASRSLGCPWYALRFRCATGINLRHCPLRLHALVMEGLSLSAWASGRRGLTSRTWLQGMSCEMIHKGDQCIVAWLFLASKMLTNLTELLAANVGLLLYRLCLPTCSQTAFLSPIGPPCRARNANCPSSTSGPFSPPSPSQRERERIYSPKSDSQDTTDSSAPKRSVSYGC